MKQGRVLTAGLVLGVVVLSFLLGLGIGKAAPYVGAALDPLEPAKASDPEETMIGRVVAVLEAGTTEVGDGFVQPYQRLLVRIERGSAAGQEIEVEEGAVYATSTDRLYRLGDQVFVQRTRGPNGEMYHIADLVRTPSLALLVSLFLVLVLIIGRSKGLRALAGTLIGVIVLFAFVIPRILAGHDPLLTSILGAIVVLGATNYCIYGWNLKAHAAMAGMTLSLLVTGLLAWLFVGLTRLNGMSGDEGMYLVMNLGPKVQLQRLLLGGIIIGTLGVLDDICVSQASAVFELARANPNLGWRDLFSRSLIIGRDHIAASVNTLLLAYAGAALPLLLLLAIYDEPLLRRLSREFVAEEMVRTLVGSMGLVLAMPLTGLIASLLAQRWLAFSARVRLNRERTATAATGPRRPASAAKS